MDLSIIIVNWNTKNLLKNCLKSIFNTLKKVNYEIFVVDNASTDGSVNMIRSIFPNINLIINDKNDGFSKANNQALKKSVGRYVLLLNPDTVVLDNTLDEMVKFLDEHPEAGVSTCQVKYGDGRIQFTSGRHFPDIFTELFAATRLSMFFPKNRITGKYMMTYWDHNDTREVDVISGSFMMVKRLAIEQIGLLDERFYMYSEDVDWCFRIRKAGWKIFYVHHVGIIHYAGQSSAGNSREVRAKEYISIYIYFKKHYGRIYASIFRIIIKGLVVIKIPLLYILSVCRRNIKKKNINRDKLNVQINILKSKWE